MNSILLHKKTNDDKQRKKLPQPQTESRGEDQHANTK